MTREKRLSWNVSWRYALAVGSVGIALAVGLFLASYNFETIEFPVFLFALAVTAWYGGTGPAILALLLATLAFNYFFTEPRYSFYLTSGDVPYYLVFILFAVLITCSVLDAGALNESRG